MLKLALFGQEVNAESYAICMADMRITGHEIENIVFGNTLSAPGHRSKRFDYMLANPPFGVDWSKDEKAVRDEHKNDGFAGRFGPGLPRKSDGSLLFLMHLASHMRALEEGDRVRILDTDNFGYTIVTVNRTLRDYRGNALTDEHGKPKSDPILSLCLGVSRPATRSYRDALLSLDRPSPAASRRSTAGRPGRVLHCKSSAPHIRRADVAHCRSPRPAGDACGLSVAPAHALCEAT